MLENKYIKFSFSKEKRNEYNRINGRKFYEYKSNSIAEDYIDGCGFSFGDISKCFYYFEDGNYGEQLMFIETLNNEKYYCREYEYLGKKSIISNRRSVGA